MTDAENERLLFTGNCSFFLLREASPKPPLNSSRVELATRLAGAYLEKALTDSPCLTAIKLSKMNFVD